MRQWKCAILAVSSRRNAIAGGWLKARQSEEPHQLVSTACFRRAEAACRNWPGNCCGIRISLAHRQSLQGQQHEGSLGPIVKETRLAAKDAEFYAWTHLVGTTHLASVFDSDRQMPLPQKQRAHGTNGLLSLLITNCRCSTNWPVCCSNACMNCHMECLKWYDIAKV